MDKSKLILDLTIRVLEKRKATLETAVSYTDFHGRDWYTGQAYGLQQAIDLLRSSAESISVEL